MDVPGIAHMCIVQYKCCTDILIHHTLVTFNRADGAAARFTRALYSPDRARPLVARCRTLWWWVLQLGAAGAMLLENTDIGATLAFQENTGFPSRKLPKRAADISQRIVRISRIARGGGPGFDSPRAVQSVSRRPACLAWRADDEIHRGVR
jgi:hypothetical protein